LGSLPSTIKNAFTLIFLRLVLMPPFEGGWFTC
jgi:hypothetical protein